MVVYDRICGEPVAWGRDLTCRIDEKDFELLRSYGDLTCLGRERWVLVDEWLSEAQAIERYGQITLHDYGSFGGWKSTTFGTKTFGSRYMSPTALEARRKR